MSVSKIATSAVMALSLVVVPTLAQAAPAASRLAVTAPTGATVARVGAHTAKGDSAIGRKSLIFIVLGLLAVGGGIAAAVSNNNNSPISR